MHNSINLPVEENELLKTIGTVSIKDELIINDSTIKLLCTFDNNKIAIQNIMYETETLLDYIQEKYALDEFSDSTWKQYKEKMYQVFIENEHPDWYNESNIEFRKLRNFFDIYENTQKNIDLIAQANSYSNARELYNDFDFCSQLPITRKNDLLELEELFTPLTLTRSSDFSISLGCDYAQTYATSSNSEYEYFSNGDCANFVSQILEAGGVQQEVYSSVYSGWWHTKSTILFITTHSHSHSWTLADVFARYMGVGYTTTSNTLFANNIQRGDFIAADFTGDGDWEHMGFIVSVNSYFVDGYHPYRVAQHTPNYLEWTTSSNNSWDLVGSDGGIYGRVRR